MELQHAITPEQHITQLVAPHSFPADRHEVDEHWVLATLSPHPAFRSDPIRNVTLRHMGDGIGQLSALLLARLTCRSGAIRSVVIKLQAPLPEMHAVAMTYGHYETEVNFYAHMADEVDLRTPEVYVSEMDHVRERVVVVMEAFTDWHSPDQIKGAQPTEIRTAVKALATLAGTYWNNPPKDRFDWLKSMDAPEFASLPDDCAVCVAPLMTRFQAQWPEHAENTLATISTNMARVRDAIGNGVQVVSHWDFRVENLFFGSRGELAIIDWQLMQINNPANDLAYLLATNIDAALRRQIEKPMLEEFLAGLKAQGVNDYNMQDLRADFRLALLGITPILIIGGAHLDQTNIRSLALFEHIGKRLLGAIDDWQALDVLEEIA